MSAFDNIGDTISNLTLYDIKSAVRKVQNGEAFLEPLQTLLDMILTR